MLKKYLKETAKYALRSHIFTRKYEKEIDRFYAMSPEELKARNEQKFLFLFKRLYTKSAYYRSICQEIGVGIDDIKRIEDIVKLPILTKDMLKKHGKELLLTKSPFIIKAHTSGTTGTPLYVYRTWHSIWWEQAYLSYYRRRCGFRYGEPMVSLRGNLDRNTFSLKVHISNTLFLSSYNINKNNIEKYHQMIQSHKPKAIEGYPSSLYALAVEFKEKGLECHIPLSFTSSETLYDYQRQIIEDVFHTKLFDHYGGTERTTILVEGFDHNGYFEAPGYGISEYYDDHIITTSLINDDYPLIRYRIDDNIILKDKNAKTPEHFIPADNVKAIEGRNISFIIGKDGTYYSDSVLTFIFKVAKGVKYSQFIQHEPGSVDLNIVPDTTYNKESEQILLDGLNKDIGLDNMDVRINLIDESELRKTKLNKLALVINEVN